MRFAEQVQQQLGGPEQCLINRVPGHWLQAPVIGALQFEEYPDFAAASVALAPRLGTFEVFANIGAPQGKTAIVHFFSKAKCGMWPSFAVLGRRAKAAIAEASADGADLRELEWKYTAKGG